VLVLVLSGDRNGGAVGDVQVAAGRSKRDPIHFGLEDSSLFWDEVVEAAARAAVAGLLDSACACDGVVVSNLEALVSRRTVCKPPVVSRTFGDARMQNLGCGSPRRMGARRI
jgi:hypothetical protein